MWEQDFNDEAIADQLYVAHAPALPEKFVKRNVNVTKIQVEIV